VSVVDLVVIDPPVDCLILRFHRIVPNELEIVVVNLYVHIADRVLATVCANPHAVVRVADHIAANDDVSGSSEAADQSAIEMGAGSVMRDAPRNRVPHASPLWREIEATRVPRCLGRIPEV